MRRGDPTWCALLITALTLGCSNEDRSAAVEPGMSMEEVEFVLGVSGTEIRVPICESCGPAPTQYRYAIEGTSWFGGPEKSLLVCYVDDRVCDHLRIAL